MDDWSPECACAFAAAGGIPEARFMDADEAVPEITQGELEDELEAEYEKDARENVPQDTENRSEGVRLPQSSPGQEPQRLTQEDEEVLKQMSDEKVTGHQTVEKMHRRLGHPSSESLVRMLKVGGHPRRCWIMPRGSGVQHARVVHHQIVLFSKHLELDLALMLKCMWI